MGAYGNFVSIAKLSLPGADLETSRTARTCRGCLVWVLVETFHAGSFPPPHRFWQPVKGVEQVPGSSYRPRFSSATSSRLGVWWLILRPWNVSGFQKKLSSQSSESHLWLFFWQPRISVCFKKQTKCKQPNLPFFHERKDSIGKRLQ